VALPETALATWLDPQVELAAVNGAQQCVLAGPPAAIEALSARLSSAGIHAVRLPITRAFHTSAMAPAAQALTELLRREPLQAPAIPFTSNVSGGFISGDEASQPEYWGRQLRSPVRFAAQLEQLLADEAAVFVELGPQPQVSAMARAHPRYAGHTLLGAAAPARQGGLNSASLLRCVGELWALGVPCDFQRRYAAARPQSVSLPSYPFERAVHWVGPQRPAEVEVEPAAVPEPIPESTIQAAASELNTHAALRALYRQLLSDRELTGGEDFFQLGGNSLLAAQLMSEVERQFGTRISIRMFYDDPRLDALASAIDQQLSRRQETRDHVEL